MNIKILASNLLFTFFLLNKCLSFCFTSDYIKKQSYICLYYLHTSLAFKSIGLISNMRFRKIVPPHLFPSQPTGQQVGFHYTGRCAEHYKPVHTLCKYLLYISVQRKKCVCSFKSTCNCQESNNAQEGSGSQVGAPTAGGWTPSCQALSSRMSPFQ